MLLTEVPEKTEYHASNEHAIRKKIEQFCDGRRWYYCWPEGNTGNSLAHLGILYCASSNTAALRIVWSANC